MFLPWEGWYNASELTRFLEKGGAGRSIVAPLVAAEGRKEGAGLVVAASQGSAWQQQPLQRRRCPSSGGAKSLAKAAEAAARGACQRPQWRPHELTGAAPPPLAPPCQCTREDWKRGKRGGVRRLREQQRAEVKKQRGQERQRDSKQAAKSSGGPWNFSSVIHFPYKRFLGIHATFTFTWKSLKLSAEPYLGNR